MLEPVALVLVLAGAALVQTYGLVLVGAVAIVMGCVIDRWVERRPEPKLLGDVARDPRLCEARRLLERVVDLDPDARPAARAAHRELGTLLADVKRTTDAAEADKTLAEAVQCPDVDAALVAAKDAQDRRIAALLAGIRRLHAETALLAAQRPLASAPSLAERLARARAHREVRQIARS